MAIALVLVKERLKIKPGMTVWLPGQDLPPIDDSLVMLPAGSARMVAVRPRSRVTTPASALPKKHARRSGFASDFLVSGSESTTSEALSQVFVQFPESPMPDVPTSAATPSCDGDEEVPESDDELGLGPLQPIAADGLDPEDSVFDSTGALDSEKLPPRRLLISPSLDDAGKIIMPKI